VKIKKHKSVSLKHIRKELLKTCKVMGAKVVSASQKKAARITSGAQWFFRNAKTAFYDISQLFPF